MNSFLPADAHVIIFIIFPPLVFFLEEVERPSFRHVCFLPGGIGNNEPSAGWSRRRAGREQTLTFNQKLFLFPAQRQALHTAEDPNVTDEFVASSPNQI